MNTIKTAGAVILAGGSGSRFGGEIPKQFVDLNGMPLFFNAVKAFAETGLFKLISIVVSDQFRDVSEKAREQFPQLDFVFSTPGETRQESVFNALKGIVGQVETVFIHDGARPLVTHELIVRCFNALAGAEAVCPAVRPADSLFTVTEEGVLSSYLDRSAVRAAQTPQAFYTSAILAAHTKAAEEGREFTDDTGLFAYYEGKVKIVEGDVNNIKVSYQQDLELVKQLLREK